MTDAEQLLWRELRRNTLGWRFRRQFPIPPYIVDFACIEARLIIEIDGGQHATPVNDERRDDILRRQGWRVLRFWNNEVFENRAGVLQTIAERWALAVRLPPPQPSPACGGGSFRFACKLSERGLGDVPHRHRCRRHVYRSRRDRRRAARRRSPRCRRPRTTRRSACSTGSNSWPPRLGLDRAALLAQTDRIVHGTTVATNALLERKGARLGLLTTEGHRDVIEMREGLKDDRYNLRMPPPEQLVPRRLRLGGARADARRRPRRNPARPGLARRRDRRAATGKGRGGRGLLPARLARPAPRARDRRGARPRAARRLCLAVLGGTAADQGVRAGLDDGRQRLCRPGAVALSGAARNPARRGRLSRPDPDHPVAWRRRADRRGRAARGRRRAVGAGRRRRRQRLCRAARRRPAT